VSSASSHQRDAASWSAMGGGVADIGALSCFVLRHLG
jgi:hypothetical protein